MFFLNTIGGGGNVFSSVSKVFVTLLRRETNAAWICVCRRVLEDQSCGQGGVRSGYASGINFSVACMIGLADVTRYVNVGVFTRRHLR